MDRLHSWHSAARRSPSSGLLVAVALVVALVGRRRRAGHRGTPTPAPTAHTTSTRAVALGDSVPYGHGLHNPYLTPQVGPARQLVSRRDRPARPTRAWWRPHLGLTMSVRPTNCDLTGDQLAISGAVADPADNTSRDGQCPRPAPAGAQPR